MNRKLQKFERIYNECSDNVIKFLEVFLKIELTSYQFNLKPNTRVIKTISV